MNPDKNRLRRTMMFLNCQKPGLIKDPYIYEPDSIILDLEDAVAANQKDSARYSLYHALKEIDYRGVERVVRINGLDTPYWREDIRVCVAAGADAIRIAKTESAADVKAAEEAVLAGMLTPRRQHSADGGPGIRRRRIKRPGNLPFLRPFIRNCAQRRRFHEGSPDFDYRDRGGTGRRQAAYDPGSQGC